MGKKFPKTGRNADQSTTTRDKSSEAQACEMDRARIGDEKLGLWASVVGVVSFAIYLPTVFPSIAGGDATEFSFIACGPGTAHPPGYPLWTMMTHLAVRFGTVGSPAYRSNACAALTAASANAVLFLVCTRVSTSGSGGPSAALLTTGLFAFGQLTWLYAIQAEVFALNNLLIAATLLLTMEFLRTPRVSVARWGAFLCGLALTNQLISVFVLIPCVCLVLWAGERQPSSLTTAPSANTSANPTSTSAKPSSRSSSTSASTSSSAASMWTSWVMAQLVLCGLAGLSPYLYLPLVSPLAFPGSWGDLTTLPGLVTHLLRSEYGTFRLFAGADQDDSRFLLGLKQYFLSVVDETRMVGPLLFLVGVVATIQQLRKSNLAPALCLVLFALYTGAFHKMANLPLENPLHLGVMARFWLQSHLLLTPVLAAGLSAILRSLIGRIRAATKGGEGRGKADQAERVMTAAAVCLVLAHAGLNFNSMNETGNTLFADYGRAFLDHLPQDARLIVKGDLITNSVRYLQRCEGIRPDVQMVDQAMLTYKWFIPVQGPNFPLFRFPGTNYHPHESGAFSMRQLLEANFGDGQGDIFMAGGWHEQDNSHEGVFALTAHGYCEKVVRSSEQFQFSSPLAFVEENVLRLPNLTFPARTFLEDRWEVVAIKDYYQSRHKLAYALLKWAESHDSSPEYLPALWAAVRMIEWCIERHPAPLPAYYPRNLGIMYQRIVFVSRVPAHHWKAVEAYKLYLEVAHAADPVYESVREFVVNGPHPPVGVPQDKPLT